MELHEIVSMLAELGIPLAYHHFAEGESPAPPFLLYLSPGSDNFSADGRVYWKTAQLDVELYTDLKDPELEERLEAVLDAAGLFYNKTESYIDSEKLYEILYEMEV
ncbi:MAG: hypothetical protein HFF38_07180 [Lawsonibacter sp.]|nr:hypothetical protein [Lawsonibacter sp.]